MKIDLLEYHSWHLNVFRAYGSKSHCEDNVTRALLCVIAKSANGELLLDGLLRRCISNAANDEVSKRNVPLLKKAISQVHRASIGTQALKYLGTTDDPDKLDFSVLIELTPTSREARAPELVDALHNATGRFDAILECDYGDDGAFLLAVEAKLYADETDEKLQKYRAILGPETCISVKLSWSDIFGLLDCLPDENRRDPIVKDFIEYLEDMWWLAGFRGFRAEDFQEGARGRRCHKLRQLASDLAVTRGGSMPAFACCRPLRDPTEVDLLPTDQFSLIGNVGLATWDDFALYAKLVIGSFRFDYDGEPELTERLRAGAHRQWAIAESYHQFNLFAKINAVDVRKSIQKANNQSAEMNLPPIMAGIGFRCFFGRFGDNDIWISSRTFNTMVDDDWQDFLSALNCAKSLEGQEVTAQTVQEVRGFLTDEKERVKGALADSKLTRSQKKRPTHHASVLFTIQMDWKSITSEKEVDGQVKLVRDAVTVLLGLLREFSAAVAP